MAFAGWLAPGALPGPVGSCVLNPTLYFATSVRSPPPQAARKREQEERALAEERAREKSQRSYTLLQVDEKKESNKEVGINADEYEDDFM